MSGPDWINIDIALVRMFNKGKLPGGEIYSFPEHDQE
jgi:hypothetical protein